MITRKDTNPKNTINRIKGILEKHSIGIVEKQHFNIRNEIFSVRIELQDIPGIGANGKGISKEYALASAYAELMERLQSGLLIKASFLNKENNIAAYSDEFLLDADDFIMNYSGLIQNIFNGRSNSYLDSFFNFVKSSDMVRYCTDFYDVINMETIALPIKMINLLAHSNGLCAGNSYEEALNQGICEVFERYSYKTLMLNKLKLASICHEDIEKTNSYIKLKQLSEMGYSYQVKDCSLNGKYPVVGLLVFNSEKTKYLFTMGSDPDFDIALQRCITEMFQGLDSDTLEIKMKDMDNGYEIRESDRDFVFSNWLKCYTSNSGVHPSSIFDDSQKTNIDALPFINNSGSNKECLDYLISILKNNNLNIYVKNYSFLGFPTYRVYIPTLSEVDNITVEEFDLVINSRELKNTYFNLGTCKESDAANFVSLFEKVLKLYKYSDLVTPSSFFNVSPYIISDITNLNYVFILILLAFKTGNTARINKLLNEELSFHNPSSAFAQFIVSILYIINRKNDESIYIDNPAPIYMEALELFSDAEKYISKFSFPSCPDCSICKCSKGCKYNEWLKLRKLLEMKYSSWMPGCKISYQ